MILSGKAIQAAVERGDIRIDPFNPEQCGPNSYDVCLGDEFREVIPNYEKVIHTAIASDTKPCREPVLQPNRVYLGITKERIWSNKYVPILHGRSSVGRHGLAIHITAGFCDVGWEGRIVLELVNHTGYPMILHPGCRIGQLSFHPVEGEVELYNSTYQGQDRIISAKGLV